jgi:hypothetical protein
MAGLATQFDDLLRGVYEDEQRETIRAALVNSEIEDEPDLRDIVAGANRIEATTLLQNSLSGLSYQDAAVLAGLVLPRGNLPSLLPVEAVPRTPTGSLV